MTKVDSEAVGARYRHWLKDVKSRSNSRFASHRSVTPTSYPAAACHIHHSTIPKLIVLNKFFLIHTLSTIPESGFQDAWSFLVTPLIDDQDDDDGFRSRFQLIGWGSR
jgi:hypothetical protein